VDNIVRGIPDFINLEASDAIYLDNLVTFLCRP